MPDIKLGVCGAGTVGSGVVKILDKQILFFQEKLGLPVKLHRISDRNQWKLDELPTGDAICTTDVMDPVRDPDIDIIIEVIGGTTFAKDLVLEAISNKKHIVTANKALIAEFGPEIFSAAEKNGVSVYFEAAVGGGMPAIKTIREALIGNDVVSVNTIINGTCNYILTEMTQKGAPFEPTLKIAQELGYAEADPTLDIEGGDTGHKIAIIASLLFGGYIPYEKLNIEGITKITDQDILAAKELGYTIKLLGVVKKRLDEDAVDVRVNPVMLHNNHILASVNDVFNAVLVEGDAVGPVLLYGAGAGEMPTASSVVGDIVDVVRNIHGNDTDRISMNYYNRNNELPLKTADKIESRYYLRFTVDNKAGVLGTIADSLAKRGISIASVVQKEDKGEAVPVIILTYMATELDLNSAIKEIEQKDWVKEATQIIRIED